MGTPFSSVNTPTVEKRSLSARGYDQLAPLYRPLEFLAFGRDLERTRCSLLPHLKNCRRILVLGEGDGRCLAQLVDIAPTAQIHCLDLSAAMLKRARHRLGGKATQVTFQQADILNTELDSGPYDAVVTCFFLDCFTNSQVREIVDRIRVNLQPGTLWLWADFVLPTRGLARWRAKIWLTILITFFRWQTGLATKSLPASETILTQAGFRATNSHTYQWGLSRCVLFQQAGHP